jgi:uncharacterized membrane-anchored protein
MAASDYMKMATMRRSNERAGAAMPGVSGVARLDRRVDRLLKRVNPGDVLVVDIADLDRSTADAFVRAKVAVVVNAQPSISGRYPNLGPEVLIANGVHLVDGVGSEIFSDLKEGTRVRLDGEILYAGEQELARGIRQDGESVAASMAKAKEGLAAQLESFAASTQQHMQRERELLLNGVGLPELRTSFDGRHVLLVAKDYDFKADLRSLKHYIHEFRPVLVGVDGGADVLRDAGYRPELVVGDVDSMSDAALREAAEVVAHADRDGRVIGLPRVQDLRIEPTIFPTAGTSEDAAMLLADAGGAKLIVTVGMRATLEEFLDAGKGGIASTVLTRLKLGGRLVDAKAAAQLYQTRVSGASLILLALAAMLAIAVVLSASNAGESYWHILTDGWNHLVAWLRDLFA